MTTAVALSPIADIAPIGLEDLNAHAALQTRVDRKYVLTATEVTDLLAEAGADTRILEIDGVRSFAYRSLYFDTPDLTSYRLTAFRRRLRFKIRTRIYVDSARCWLEVKTRGARGSTVKDRLPYRPDDSATLVPGRWFVNAQLARYAIRGSETMVFVPTLATGYQRCTLFLPETSSRVTIDTDLSWERDDGRCMRIPPMAIVETKTGSTASRFDRLLWAMGHRPARISKYATGLAALRPELPARRWHRTLRRHFAVAAGP